MKFPYGDIVLEHFKHPRNVGEIEDPDGKAIEGSPACGDMVAVYISVDEERKIITDIKFQSYGCASNIATGSIITELAKGKTLDEAKKISWKDASEALGGLPKIKAHCSVLAVGGLRSAIRDYEERHGLVKEKVPTDEGSEGLEWCDQPCKEMGIEPQKIRKKKSYEWKSSVGQPLWNYLSNYYGCHCQELPAYLFTHLMSLKEDALLNLIEQPKQLRFQIEKLKPETAIIHKGGKLTGEIKMHQHKPHATDRD